MVHTFSPRDSSHSTTTVSSLRSSLRSTCCRSPSADSVPASAPSPHTSTSSNQSVTTGPMAAAASAALARRSRPSTHKRVTSQSSINSTTSSTDSLAVEKTRRSERERERATSPQPRTSIGHVVSWGSSRTESPTSLKSKAAKRRSGETVMRSGRHGDEWLFGGWSLRETVKGLLK